MRIAAKLLPRLLGLVNKLSSIFGWLRPCLPAGKFGWRCQQNSDYQPVGLRFASLPALSSLEPKRNLISLPVLSSKNRYLPFSADSL
jgi:hypothetical protein